MGLYSLEQDEKESFENEKTFIIIDRSFDVG